jgi:hypothetical protein
MAPAIGALNAVARPAPAPAASSTLAVGPAASKYLADQMPDGRRHLDTRAFTAERQPRTDRQSPPNELHQYDAKRRLRQFLVQDRLDMWDAAPRRLWRVAANQPSRYPGPGSASNANDQKAGERLRMRPDDDDIAEPVRPFKQEQEERSD